MLCKLWEKRSTKWCLKQDLWSIDELLSSAGLQHQPTLGLHSTAHQLFVKNQTVDVSGSVGHTASVAATLLCSCGTKAAIDNM